MSAAIVIPARYGSTRFAGKPLHIIRGISMLERVWRIAKSVKGCSRVIIATDDERIMTHAASFGAEACMTPETCENGTERVFAAINLAKIEEDILLNLQGDALLTPPWVLDDMINEMDGNPDVEMATPAVLLKDETLNEFCKNKQTSPASGSTVVFNKNRDALYFSKTIIPYIRNAGAANIYRHIGLYGYRRSGIKKYMSLTPTPLEKAEGLEQLRALENGMKIRIVIVDYKGRTHGSVDSPQDVHIVEEIISREGELTKL